MELDETTAAAAGTPGQVPAEASARRDALHGMLLTLAGRLPDDLITQCRDQLADGAFGELAQAITFAVLSADLTVTTAEAQTLTALLAEAGGDESALGTVRIDDVDEQAWVFAAADSDEAGPAGPPDEGRRPGDELIEAAAHALSVEPGAVGAWLAWRLAPASEHAPAKAVFLVEVGDDGDAAGAAARIQTRLTAAGEASPQVEVYYTGHPLPAYQRLVRTHGELTWAARPDPGLQVAPIFDDVDPESGPVFSPDHPRLDADEARRVAEYLSGGEAVLVTTARMDDVVDASRRYCVPMDFRTDGSWVWTEALAYYAREHQLEPDPLLLAQVRANDYTAPAVDGVGVHRALALLQEPPENEPVWTFDGPPDDVGEYDDAGSYDGEVADHGEDGDDDDRYLEAGVTAGPPRTPLA
jgi:hypothetical protein